MSFVVGYSPKDKKRIESHLRDLFPYVKTKNMVIVGGIAIRYHLDKFGVKHNFGLTNDLDMVLKSPKSLDPSVTKDFKISHFHPSSTKNERFYIVLIHPETKTKIDIFAEGHYKPMETIEVPFEGATLKMRSLEDQLATSMLEISRILNGNAMYKQFITNVELMIPHADLEKTQRFFKEKPGGESDIKDRSTTAAELLAKVKERVAKNPDLAIDKFKRKKEPYDCAECFSTEKFPITPMKKVYKLMGYIE